MVVIDKVVCIGRGGCVSHSHFYGTVVLHLRLALSLGQGPMLLLILSMMLLLLLEEVLFGRREEILGWGHRIVWRDEIIGIGVVQRPVIHIVYESGVVYMGRDRISHRIKDSRARSRDVGIAWRALASPRVLPRRLVGVVLTEVAAVGLRC